MFYLSVPFHGKDSRLPEVYEDLTAAKAAAEAQAVYGYCVSDEAGDPIYSPVGSFTASHILYHAKGVADHMRIHGYKYGDADQNPALDKNSENPERLVSCDRFCGWALYEAGFTAHQPKTKGLPLYFPPNLEQFLIQSGFTRIEDPAEVRPGDLIFEGNSHHFGPELPDKYRDYPRHVFINAGPAENGLYYRYDAGSDTRIQTVQPMIEPIFKPEQGRPFRFAYRAPEAPCENARQTISSKEASTTPSKVYFSPVITPEKVLEMYELLGVTLPGNVAIKVHSGEKGNQNFLRPDFWRPVIERVGGTVVECNTAYEGMRNTTERHRQLFRDHGWMDYCKVDLLDAEGPDLVLPIPEGKVIKENYVGKDIQSYDSMLVLSHFKGHPMGGFGGALKQLSIGCASSYGKAYIHGAGVPENFWTADRDLFLEAMADAAASVVELFKGNIVYVNVMKNMSVDCDCCAVAEDPCIADIGILVSTDPIAIDQACVDLVYACSDPGKPHLIERIESRHGIHTVEAAAELGFGSRAYELIRV